MADDHDHDHSHPDHHHIDYQTVSLVSAVTCPRCGVYLAKQFTGEHNEYHDQLDMLTSNPSPQPIGKKSKAGRSSSKQAKSGS